MYVLLYFCLRLLLQSVKTTIGAAFNFATAAGRQIVSGEGPTTTVIDLLIKDPADRRKFSYKCVTCLLCVEVLNCRGWLR
jgi:hypothetical protein